MHIQPVRSLLASAFLMLTACGSALSVSPSSAPTVAVSTQQSALEVAQQPCGFRFSRTDLPHYTSGGSTGSALYASNGSGLAVGDLTGDGQPDLVFGNIIGTVTVYVNEGNFVFTPIPTTLTDVRSLAIVDADGDGTRELYATRRFAPPIVGRLSDGEFSYEPIPNVYSAFYAMGWQDLNRDGVLDVVFGTYDNEQLQQQGLIFQTRGGGGVFVYTQTKAGFTPQRLNQAAQALAIAFPDLDQDGRIDLLVGNDFNEPDAAWTITDQGYTPVAPFAQTTENTMSLDYVDYDNNGIFDLYATDMKPYDQNVATMARWLPAMVKLTRPLTADDPQYTENTLQTWDGSRWQNRAYDLQLDATGWSWSAKFADLDNNGWQDLYVVNGMKATDLLSYLPSNELAEDDMLFVTDNSERYELVDRGISQTGSGRAATMADLDNDGDLDVVVNPIDGAAQLYRNELCQTGSIAVTLVDPTSANRDAVGAIVTVAANQQTLTRSIQVSSGYLSGQPTTAHFGLGNTQAIERITITWPDGKQSEVTGITANTHYTITRKDAP